MFSLLRRVSQLLLVLSALAPYAFGVEPEVFRPTTCAGLPDTLPADNPPTASIIKTISDCADLLSIRYRVPAVVIKAMIEQESEWVWTAGPSVENVPAWCPPGSSYNGYGLMQFTQCEKNGEYTSPIRLGDINFETWDGDNEFHLDVSKRYAVSLNSIKTNWKYNLEAGVRWLLYKKAELALGRTAPLPKLLEYDANIVENWYYPLAGYNGASSGNDPSEPFPRTVSPLTPTNPQWRNKASFPYQECVFNTIAQRYAHPDHQPHFGIAIPATLPGPSAVWSGSAKSPYASDTWKGFFDGAQFRRDGKILIAGATVMTNDGTPTTGKVHAVEFGAPRDHVVTPPAGVDQYNGSTKIELGAELGGTSATFRATLLASERSGVQSTDTYKLEIELLRVDEWGGTWPTDAQAGGAIHASAPVLSGQTALVTVHGLVPGCYHWRARTVDGTRRSLWISFGHNATAAADFRVGGTVCSTARGGGVSSLACTSTLPAITTPTWSGTTQTGTTLSAAVTTSGHPANAWFELGTTQPLATRTPPASFAASGSSQTLSRPIVGLECGTSYTVRAGVSTAVATQYSGTTTITTLPCADLQSLAVTLTGSGSGSVTSAPSGIHCPASCSAAFAPSTLVTLTAQPGANSAFAGWSGDCVGFSTCSVTMAAARSVIATFNPSNAQPAFNVFVSGSGTVTSSPAGIHCSSNCNTTFPSGTVVTLSPQPSAGWVFTGWSGDCSGMGSCQLTMNQSKSVSAFFSNTANGQTLVVSVPGGGGFVTSDPFGINCPGNCQVTFSTGAPVKLAPHAASGWKFTQWGGDCTGNGACEVVMNALRSVTASFATTTDQNLNLSPAGPAGSNSRVAVSPGGVNCFANSNCSWPYTFGSTVQLTPIPQGGRPFTEWTGDCANFADCIVTMNRHQNIGATFIACSNDCPPGALLVNEDFRDGWPAFPEYTITGSSFSAAEERLKLRYACVRLPVTYVRRNDAGIALEADVRINDDVHGVVRLFALYDALSGCGPSRGVLTNGYMVELATGWAASPAKDVLLVVKNGVESALAQTPRRLVTAHWARIRLEHWPGGVIRLYVDDELVLSALDSSFTSGSITLAGAGESTEIDDVVVRMLGPTPPPLDPPMLVSASPVSGPGTGGTTVTLTGANFAGETAIAFGETPAASIELVSPSTVRVVTPSHAAGVVDIVASNGLASDRLSSAFEYLPVAPAAPAGLSATATSQQQVALTWSAVAGASHFEIQRRADTSGFVDLGTASSPAFTDSSVLAGKSYVYRVRAVGATGLPSGYSAPEVASTFVFTDDPIVARTTRVKAVHVTQLRTAIDTLRAVAGLSAATFTDPALVSGTKPKTAHVTELRTALNEALSSLGLNPVSFTNPTLAAGSTRIRRAHVTELRDALR